MTGGLVAARVDGDLVPLQDVDEMVPVVVEAGRGERGGRGREGLVAVKAGR